MQAQKSFDLFKEKTEKLLNSRFIKDISDSGVSISGTIGQPIKSSRKGPDFEAIENFSITFRAFILDGDGISIHQISKIYGSLDEDNDLKERFDDARGKFKEFLASPTTVEYNREMLTYWKLIDTYIYGKVIHFNKKGEFDTWVDASPLNHIIYNEIVVMLTTSLGFIRFFNQLNTEFLELENKITHE